jgi:pilus assembly protein CpaB
LWIYKERFEEKASGGQEVRVLIATGDIPLGAKLTPRLVGARGLPEAYLEDRHIRIGDAKRIMGIRVRSRVKAGESILWSDLAITGAEARDLASLVTPGMRAVAIPATAPSTFNGLLRPGDRVDVLLTTLGSSEQRMTIPLLQNLLVLATGQDVEREAEQSNARANRRATITLGVTVEQSQVLTFGRTRGELTLVLRNPDDIRIAEGLPETTMADIVQPARRARVQKSRPTTPELPPASDIENVR